jgi:hypothetical protein
VTGADADVAVDLDEQAHQFLLDASGIIHSCI